MGKKYTQLLIIGVVVCMQVVGLRAGDSSRRKTVAVKSLIFDARPRDEHFVTIQRFLMLPKNERPFFSISNFKGKKQFSSEDDIMYRLLSVFDVYQGDQSGIAVPGS